MGDRSPSPAPPSRPNEYYFGATGGGVWKTTDGGTTWRPVADEALRTSSVGALAVAESNPDIVFAGMGEVALRGNVIQGDGVYKSTDGGKTWKHTGLADTQNIARIRIHPSNPDIVYVAALGHTYGPNAERGVFRSQDGGATWKRVLFRSEKAGAVDLCLDPRNPQQLFAALWEVYRTPHSLSSGGPGSGLFKSTDGGDTWTEISRNPGLPKGLLGKIGVSVSGADASRVYAIVEAEDGGIFRSDDGGATWSKVNDERRFRQRAFYYSRIYADPKDRDRLYVLNTGLYRSTDAGKTWKAIRVPHGDNHDLWIAPNDTQRLDQRQRRRRERLGERRRDLDGSAVSDGAALSRDDDGPRALPRVRRAAGQQHRLRAGDGNGRRLLRRRAAARAATSRRTRGTPTSSTPAATAAC